MGPEDRKGYWRCFEGTSEMDHISGMGTGTSVSYELLLEPQAASHIIILPVTLLRLD